jgi:hypothetical protein
MNIAKYDMEAQNTLGVQDMLSGFWYPALCLFEKIFLIDVGSQMGGEWIAKGFPVRDLDGTYEHTEAGSEVIR